MRAYLDSLAAVMAVQAGSKGLPGGAHINAAIGVSQSGILQYCGLSWVRIAAGGMAGVTGMLQVR